MKIQLKSLNKIQLLKFFNAMFANDDFLWKFRIGLNLLFGKLKNFKFEFGSNSTIIFKVVKVENLKMTIQNLSFSNSSFIIKIVSL